MILAPQIKIIAALSLISAGLGYALYWQIGKTAEVHAALKVFQAELAARVEENTRLNSVLIERERRHHDERAAAQSKQTAIRTAAAKLPKDDCINADIPDDIRVLIGGSAQN